MNADIALSLALGIAGFLLFRLIDKDGITLCLSVGFTAFGAVIIASALYVYGLQQVFDHWNAVTGFAMITTGLVSGIYLLFKKL